MSKKESDSINMAVENFRKPLAMTLSMPKDEPEKNTIQLKAKFVTVILLASGNLWCYEDTSLSSGALYHNNEFQHFISVKKKEFGDSILVVIKPTAQATYKATVDALDQMTINQIKRYAIVKPNEGEERFLSAKGIIELHAPIEIKTPKSTSSQSLSDSSTVIIDIKKDSSVWFTNFTGKNGIYDKVSIKLKEPITVELSQFIRSEKSLYSSYKREYIIRSAPNTDYRTFEKVIEALKQNNINKYNHITTAE
jgi:biopolymer transport protein ExbD